MPRSSPKIIQKEDPLLRQIAKEVPLSKIKSREIKKIISDMKKSLATQADGVAIAAPQIGASVRIFVVAGKIFNSDFRREGNEPIEQTETPSPDLVFINPVITKLSKTKKWMHEGCLSVRPLWGEVNRSTNATIVAYDENGTKITRGAGGLLAHIFQHETDHLDGILFIDKAKNIATGEVPPEVTSAKKSKAKK